MSYFRAENLSLHFGGLKAVDAVSFAGCSNARTRLPVESSMTPKNVSAESAVRPDDAGTKRPIGVYAPPFGATNSA